MATPFSATDLIALPRVSTSKLLSLMRQLEIEAGVEALPLLPGQLHQRPKPGEAQQLKLRATKATAPPVGGA
jgi:hypothetical protein